MPTPNRKSLIPTTFYEHARHSRRGLYWLTPAIVLVLYLCVMGAFIWLQRLQSDSVMFVTIDQETRQQRLMMVVFALSLVIVFSLLALWRYTRFRTQAEAALLAETGFRRAMENSMSTGMRVFDMQGRIAYVNPAFCRMIGWNKRTSSGARRPSPTGCRDGTTTTGKRSRSCCRAARPAAALKSRPSAGTAHGSPLACTSRRCAIPTASRSAG
ncbi:hypothetical protein SXANM310S_03870 [Streptomyces xanthochromogenes]